MRKLLLFIAVFCCISSFAEAQSRKFKKYYADKLEVGSRMVKASKQWTIEETKTGDFIKKIYYPETRVVTHFITYRDYMDKLPEGMYKEYYDTGKIWKEGEMKAGQPHGHWRYYNYFTGAIGDQGNYKEGKRVGTWIGLDSLGNTVRQQTYQDGKLHGLAYTFDSEGDTISVAKYDEGETIFRNIRGETVNTPDLKEAPESFPFIKSCADQTGEERITCSNQTLARSIYSNIKYPASARMNDIEGKAIIRFIVEKDGSVSEITVFRGICSAIERECLRALQEHMPEWQAGTQQGKPVRVEFRLPIQFSLH